MSSLDTLKNDIQVIEELSDTTEILEQVAAKSIIETRENILKSREFFSKSWDIYNTLRQLTDLGPNVYSKDLVIIITPNRGMCGSLVGKVVRAGEKIHKSNQSDLLITGKKGHSFFTNQDEKTIHFFSVPNNATYEDIEPLKNVIAKYASVHVVYPRYISISQQSVEVVSLVSEEIIKSDRERKIDKIKAKRYIIEPDLSSVVDYLNKTIIGILFFSYFSESLLAYNAAQMLAMRNAHDNANDQLKGLSYQYLRLKREVINSKLRDLYNFKYVSDSGE